MTDIEKIALAGLFHDIGKFRQRCGLEDISDGELSTFCPSHKTYYSHIHAAHTAKALEEMGMDTLIQLAANHHLENLEGDELIIQLADRFASSLDRKENSEQLSKIDFITSAIETPFSYVYLSEEPPKHYYPLQKLQGNIEITDIKNSNDQNSYRDLYEEFLKEFKALRVNLKHLTWQNILEIKSVLEKYTTFIPSSTYKTYPDVSLFDHSLATAAIATAIKRGDGEHFSLVQGDFTSIQNFIFSKFGESNRYLAKILRAKSLFVNVATEMIALRVVKALGLTPLSIVMNAGGKFLVLSHQINEQEKEELENIKKWINDEFSKINFLQTKFVIKSIDFKQDSFHLGKFSEVYKKMALAFEAEKLRFIPPNDVFDGYIEKIAHYGKCEICGIVPEAPICSYCKKFKEIGEALPKAKFINFNLDDLMSITLDSKSDKEFSFGLSSHHPLKRIANVVPKFAENDKKNEKYALIKEKFEEDELRPNTIKSFYHIAVDGLKVEGDKIKGKPYLAILKADIDNLGKIFICGFDRSQEGGKNESTFSRILYLSRMIDYFFTTILMDFIEKKNIYTVFAGGDDLFLIGHYADIVETYQWLVKNFKEYVKNNDFHLSSAIRLTRANVPLNLMSEFAEEDLEEAKCLDGKDGVTIFDIAMKNSEFLVMLELVPFFAELHTKLQAAGSGSSMMYKLYTFIEMEHSLKNGGNPLQNSWRHKLRYLIEKNFDKQTQEHIEIRKKLYEVVDMIENYDYKLIVPLNLFLYSIREGVKNV